jgi:hypothetical protein
MTMSDDKFRTFLRDQSGFEGLARKLGQDDPPADLGIATLGGSAPKPHPIVLKHYYRMRKFFALGALVIAITAITLSAPHGREILSLFGIRVTQCDEARWLNMVGYHVPMCTCCVQPPPPPRSSPSSN